MRRHHDRAKSEQIVRQPRVQENFCRGQRVHAKYLSVAIDHCHHAQDAQGQQQLDAVQVVEVADSVTNALVPHPEQLDVSGRGSRHGRGRQLRGGRRLAAEAASVGQLQQHGRVSVSDDRRRLERGHVLVDPTEPSVQLVTASHVVDFRRTCEQVLGGHEYEEHGDGVVANVPADQVHAVRVRRKYGEGVH